MDSAHRHQRAAHRREGRPARRAGGREAPGAATPTTAANFPAALGSLLAGATPFGLGIGWLASNFALDLQIQALEGQRRARVLSSPSLLTTDNQPATVASGRKFPIISLTAVQGAQQASITFQDVTTRLQVTPRVVGDGRLVLTIAVKDEIETERINTQFLIAPIVATRQTVTQADIADGGTVVISGLRQEAFNNDERGIPWLSKIPVLGWLFKNDLTETVRRELVVFLTAKIVSNPGQANVAPPEPPAAPGAPAPPGPSGEAPTTTIPKTVSPPGAPAPQGLNGPVPRRSRRRFRRRPWHRSPPPGPRCPRLRRGSGDGHAGRSEARDRRGGGSRLCSGGAASSAFAQEWTIYLYGHAVPVKASFYAEEPPWIFFRDDDSQYVFAVGCDR